MSDFKQFQLGETPSTTPESIVNEGGQTFLKQGEFQSPNFKTGEKGWKVNSEGDAEFQSVKIRLSKGVFGGNGSDGALVIVSGTTTIDLGNAKTVTKNYTSISITGSGKLAFSNPHSTGSYIILKSQGNVTLTSSSDPNIDATGMGATGGVGGDAPPEDGTDGTTAAPLLDSSAHFGAAGTSGGGGAGGAVYTNTLFLTTTGDKYRAFGKHLVCGSGGGGGRASNVGVGGNGGKGGGSLIIECAGDLNCTGNIDVEGQAGADGTGNAGAGGGGGSGGTCLVFYNTKTAISGTISDAGGNGGASGPGGENAGGGAGGIGGAGVSGSAGAAGGGGGGAGAGSGTTGGAATTSADHYIQI